MKKQLINVAIAKKDTWTRYMGNVNTARAGRLGGPAGIFINYSGYIQ